MAGNTAPIHGRVCRIDKGGTLIDFSSDWTINGSIDLSDASRQGQAWKENVAGQGGWSGSMTMHLALANTEQKALLDNIVSATPGVKLTDLKFNLEDTGDYFSGDIFLTSFAVSTAVGDTVNVSFDFTGDGALSSTTA